MCEVVGAKEKTKPGDRGRVRGQGGESRLDGKTREDCAEKETLSRPQGKEEGSHVDICAERIHELRSLHGGSLTAISEK